MEKLTIISLLVVLALLGIYNGELLRFAHSVTPVPKKYWSDRFHATGFVIRIFVAIAMIPVASPCMILLALFVAWPVYNAAINTINSVGLLYIGNTAWIDRNIPHWLHYSLYALILASAVLCMILNIQFPWQ
jgi:hypothetical protein